MFLCRSEEGDKELAKERERITPFITFQQVTTSSTNASSSKNVLPSTQTSATDAGAILSKIVTTLTAASAARKDKLQLHSTKETISSILPRSTIEEIRDVPSTTTESSNAMSLTTSPELLQAGGVDIHHINGDLLADNQELTLAEPVPTISSPKVSTISMVNDALEGTGLIMDQVIHVRNPATSPPMMTANSPLMVQHHYQQQQLLQPQHHTATTSATRRDGTTSLKRSYACSVDVDEMVVTSSAKRPIVQSNYMSSCSPLHHPPHLNQKQMWASETSMIIDQHNNNG